MRGILTVSEIRNARNRSRTLLKKREIKERLYTSVCRVLRRAQTKIIGGLRNTTDKGTQHGFFEDCRAERGLPRFIRSAFLTCPAAGLWRATPTTQNGRMKPIPDERAYFSYTGASGTDARTTERGLRTAPISGYTMWSFGKTRCG